MHLNGIYLFNICREKTKVMHLEFLLYIFVHQGPPWLQGLVLKPYQLMHCFTSRQSLTWAERVWKTPFPFQFFNLEFLPPLPPRNDNTFAINCWYCNKSEHSRSWVTPAILFTLLRRNAVNYPGSPESWETAGKPLHDPFFTRLENWREVSLSNLWLPFLLRTTKIADVEGMVRARMASLCPSKLGPSPAVLLLEGRGCLSVECSPKWVPYSRMLIAVENIYEWAYLMKWFVDPKKLLYLIKSTEQEI